MQTGQFRPAQHHLGQGLLCASFVLFSALTPPSSALCSPAYPVIDAYARATPEVYTRDLNTLTDYLIAPARSDLGKARSIYTWILTHVRYSYGSRGDGYYTSEADYVRQVLKTRRAVCTGFALLFKHMLLRAGVDAYTVKGYARAKNAEAGRPISQIDHEWNAVSLDGDWYLFDLTWASNTANEYYFLTNPETFISSHFPSDPRWQLLSPPVSKAEFDRYPKVHDGYFRFGFDPDFPRNGLIHTNETITLKLNHPATDVTFTCMAGQSGTSRSVPLQTSRVGNTYQLIMSIPQRGIWTITVLGGSKSRGFAAQSLLSFTAIRD